MLGIADDLLALRLVHPEHSKGIVDAGITVYLSEGIENEGTALLLQLGATCRVQLRHLISLWRAARHSPGLEARSADLPDYAVRDFVDLLQSRRQAPQRLYQTFVAVDLKVQLHDHIVERKAGLAERFVLLGDFAKGIGMIESEVLILRIKHQRQLVALLHQIDHLTAPAIVPRVQPFFP